MGVYANYFIQKLRIIQYFIYQIACPNFGHPAQTSSFTKYILLQAIFFSSTNVNELSVWKLFQLWNGDLLFS